MHFQHQNLHGTDPERASAMSARHHFPRTKSANRRSWVAKVVPTLGTCGNRSRSLNCRLKQSIRTRATQSCEGVQGPQSHRIPSLRPETASTGKFRNTRVRHAAHCKRKWRSGQRGRTTDCYSQTIPLSSATEAGLTITLTW